MEELIAKTKPNQIKPKETSHEENMEVITIFVLF